MRLWPARSASWRSRSGAGAHARRRERRCGRRRSAARAFIPWAVDRFPKLREIAQGSPRTGAAASNGRWGRGRRFDWLCLSNASVRWPQALSSNPRLKSARAGQPGAESDRRLISEQHPIVGHLEKDEQTRPCRMPRPRHRPASDRGGGGRDRSPDGCVAAGHQLAEDGKEVPLVRYSQPPARCSLVATATETAERVAIPQRSSRSGTCDPGPGDGNGVISPVDCLHSGCSTTGTMAVT
jgi:hypothetical protein